MIAPQVDAPCVVIAEDQHEYKPITAALVVNTNYAIPPGRAHNTVLLAFRPNEAERVRLAAGDDVYIALLTFGGPMQPICVLSGKEDASLTFNVPVSQPEAR